MTCSYQGSLESWRALAKCRHMTPISTAVRPHLHMCTMVVPIAAEAELDLPGFGKGWVRELRERVDGRGGALS